MANEVQINACTTGTVMAAAARTVFFGADVAGQARTVAGTDICDAMTSQGSCPDILPREKVRWELTGGRGMQFDNAFWTVC